MPGGVAHGKVPDRRVPECARAWRLRAVPAMIGRVPLGAAARGGERMAKGKSMQKEKKKPKQKK